MPCLPAHGAPADEHDHWNRASLCNRASPAPTGILGLPYALASLGWVAGTLTLTFITASSCYSAFLLADVSRGMGARGAGERVGRCMARALVHP